MSFKGKLNFLKDYFVKISLELNQEENTIVQLKIIRTSLFLAMGIITIIITLFYGLQNNNIYFYLLFTGFLLAQVTIRLNIKINVLKRLINFKKNWGKEITKVRDWSIITELYQVLKDEEDCFWIDERTWQDLDMDLIYQKIDRNMTYTGEQYLYYLLHKPEFRKEILVERNKRIDTLLNDIRLREGLQLALNAMGRDGGEGMVPFIWGNLPTPRSVWFFRFLALLSIISIVITIFRPVFALYTLVPVTILNMNLHYREKKRIYMYLGSLFYLGRFLSGVKKFTKTSFQNSEFQLIQRDLAEALKSVKKIIRQTSVFILKNDPIAEYLFILFHIENITFYKVLNTIKKNRESLRKIYLTIGKLDAYLSIASFRAGLKYYSQPDLGEWEFEVEELYHPLLLYPVSNSLKVEKSGVLITGSNMSGKSTMLRAIGVNALLSQTIYTSLSKKYRSKFFKILTSIGRSDNVITGDSYYMVEAKAILRIIQELNQNTPILCIVDEIFRGTNSAERIAASAEVLRYLCAANCITFAATHDLELTEMLKDELHNYHFQEVVNDKGLNFDYHLWPGPATTKNAIRLLEFIGYPTSIVEGARSVVEIISKSDKSEI